MNFKVTIAHMILGWSRPWYQSLYTKNDHEYDALLFSQSRSQAWFYPYYNLMQGFLKNLKECLFGLIFSGLIYPVDLEISNIYYSKILFYETKAPKKKVYELSYEIRYIII